MAKRRHVAVDEIGWMVFTPNGDPYFPFFKTKKEAREYNKWKTDGSYPIKKCRVLKTVQVLS